MSSVGSEAGSEGSSTSRNGEIVKTGYLKKLKTMKKKFFVLRADSQSTAACLEYYDSGKKWKNNHPAKKNIALKNCLSINRRTDTKHKYVIALFWGTECFGIVLECEDDLQEWLRLLLIHYQGEDIVDSNYPKPYYEHVWRVTIQKKELAGKYNLSGVFLLCLTDSTLSLVKHCVNDEQESKFYEFTLQSIRRCGHLDAFFYMELGQASCLGAGNLWMQADDSIVAQNMHSVIMNACTSCPKKELAPKSRSRSSSANEASKPINFGRKWPSSGDDMLSVLSYAKSHSHQDHAVNSSNSISHSDTGRERCDSLPTRPRVTLDVLSNARNGSNVSYLSSVGNRPHSMYNRSVFSPTGLSHPTSPMSTTYSNDSAGSSLSVDADCENWSEMYNNRKIIEETPNEYVQWGAASQSRNFLADNIPHSNNICRNMKPMFPPSNSNSQSSCSPCSSSPMDAGAYMPMSPPESVAENRNRPQLNRSYDSVSHSRESSIHEDVGEGYVPMAPLSVDAGYISMDHSGRKQGDLSSGLSSCSITSGTPSTDVRFSEFHLDKVSSYFAPSDEDLVANVRPTRAYSTGSKPDTLHSKFISCDSSDILRVRAFSLGSRCPTGLHAMPRTPQRTTPASTSTSSIEPDLMEMDFSANKLRRHRRYQRRPDTTAVGHANVDLPIAYSHPLIADGYMDMSPKSSPKVDPFHESRVFSTSDTNLSPPRLGKHPLGRSSPANTFSKQAFAKGSPSSGAPTLEKVLEMDSTVRRAATAAEDEYSYMDMKPGVCDVPDASTPKGGDEQAPAPCAFQRKDSFSLCDSMVASRTAAATVAVGSPSTPSPANVPHIKQPLLEMSGKQLKKADAKAEKCSTPDGYVDMTFKGRPKAAGNGLADGQPTKALAKIPDKTPDGYVDMSFSRDVRKNLVDSNSMSAKSKAQPHQPHPLLDSKVAQCCAGKENQVGVAQQPAPPRQCSKPIAIQQTKHKRANGGGAGFFRRKLSGDETHASKPNFLPLVQSTFASLGRKKKGGQKKEKAVESPATGAAIFPLSPDKNASMTSCASDGSSVSLDGDAAGQAARLSRDLEIRSLERVDEMVNWDRRGECARAEPEDDDEDENCDYIAMTPGVAPRLERKASEPTCLRRSFSGRGAEAAQDGGETRSLQRCTSVPSAAADDARSWKRCTSVPEVGKAGSVDASKGDSKATAVDCSADDRLCPRTQVDPSQPQVTQNYTDVPKTCTASSAHIPHRDKVMYATLDIPSSEENLPKNDSVDSAKSTNQSTLTYAQIDFEKPSSSSSSPSK